MPAFNNEVLVVRVEVVNSTGKDFPVNPRYHTLVKSTVVPPGRTIIRFPINDRYYSVLFTAFQKEYPELKVTVGAQDIEEF